MQLPARTEGPHCWLWRLLYRTAEAELPAHADPGRRTRAAGLLWDRVVAGSLSVRRDRSGVTEEADPWLSDLVVAEARRHVALSARLDRGRDADGHLRAKADRPPTERVDAIGQLIWVQLGNGWARVAEDEDAILFWDPETSTFVSFDLELSATYARLLGGRAAR